MSHADLVRDVFFSDGAGRDWPRCNQIGRRHYRTDQSRKSERHAEDR